MRCATLLTEPLEANTVSAQESQWSSLLPISPTHLSCLVYMSSLWFLRYVVTHETWFGNSVIFFLKFFLSLELGSLDQNLFATVFNWICLSLKLSTHRLVVNRSLCF